MLIKVKCPHKAEGCEWEGELGSLEQHLNTNSCEGECGYVDVDCPYSCGECVTRHNLDGHLSQHCPLRPFTCQYCNHEATHQEVTKDHWPVCEKYPLPCPNECGEEEMERQHLKGHLEQTCPLEVIQCEFNYAGCGAKLQRRLMPTHLKENVEYHLSFVVRASMDAKEIVQQQGDQIKQQEDQIKQQGDQIKQQGEQIKQQGEQFAQQAFNTNQQLIYKEVQIKALASGKKFTILPKLFVMDRFSYHKSAKDSWFSPPFYSHLGGFKLCLRVDANGKTTGIGTHMSMYVFLMRGEFDNYLVWPLNFDIRILVVKDYTQRKFSQTIISFRNTNRALTNNTAQFPVSGYDKYLPHTELNGYLHNDSLYFIVSNFRS